MLGNHWPLYSAILDLIKQDWEGDFQVRDSSKVRGFNFIGTLKRCKNTDARVDIQKSMVTLDDDFGDRKMPIFPVSSPPDAWMEEYSLADFGFLPIFPCRGTL